MTGSSLSTFHIVTIGPCCFRWSVCRKPTLTLIPSWKRTILPPQGPPGSLNHTLRTARREIWKIWVPEERNYLKMYPTIDFCLIKYNKSLRMVSIWYNDGSMPLNEILVLLLKKKKQILPYVAVFSRGTRFFPLNNPRLIAFVFKLKSRLTNNNLASICFAA